ncbi:hypothetical protein FQN54_005715 [Arachnomyces sp. PD_36]|nr:hypothetical protein FQN54_005715 [Arachnomyces sp. PD_36]
MSALAGFSRFLRWRSGSSQFHTSRPQGATIVKTTVSQPAVPRPQLLASRGVRPFGSTARRAHATVLNGNPQITFTDQEGKHHKLNPSLGDNLLGVAQAHGLELEGSCGGSCGCSTCHVIVADQEFYDRMPEPDEDENDMLDEAVGRTDLSRLGCQVKVTESLDGLVVRLSPGRADQIV